MEKKGDGVEIDPAAPPEGVETDPKAPKGNEDGTDYKTLLEEALEREENYKRALQQKRQLRQKPQDPPPSVDDEDDNRPLKHSS